MSGPDKSFATLPVDESAFLEDAINRAIGRRLREERRRLTNVQTSPSLRTLARQSQALDVAVTTVFRGFACAQRQVQLFQATVPEQPWVPAIP